MADTTHKLPEGHVLPIPGAAAPTEARVARPALEVPGYEVRRELARGGMGLVVEAWSKRLGRTVALKLVLEPLDTELVARFGREAEAALRLRHPNLVSVFEAGEVGGCPFLAMELVEGRTLEEVLRGGPLPALEAARMVRALADALAHAHERGVLHRDLKPGNVIVEADGRPRLVDFGLARLSDELARLTRTGAIMGTPSYMSPEQGSGEIHRVGPQTDVYSLGAVLYHALTGSAPFVAKSAIATIEAVVRRRPVPPDQVRAGVDRDLAAICLRCLEKAPEQRWPGAAALRDALLAWERGARTRPRPRRSGRWIALAAVALGGVLAAGLAARSPRAASPAAPAPEELARLLDERSERSLEAALALVEASGVDLAALDPDRAAALRFAGFLRHRRADRRAGNLHALRAAPPPWCDLARLEDLLEDERTADALELARTLRGTFPRLAWVRFAAARALSDTRRFDEALAESQAALALHAEPEVRLWRALILAGKADPGALTESSAAVDLAPRGSPLQLVALETRAQCHLALGDLASARADLDRVLAGDPDRTIALVTRAHVHLAGGDQARALADVDRARERGPDDPHALRVLGLAVARVEGPLEGLAWLDRAIAAEPLAADAHADRAGILRDLRWLDAALASARRAVELAPDQTRFHDVLVGVLLACGLEREALAQARELVRVDPTGRARPGLEALEQRVRTTAGWIDPAQRQPLTDHLDVLHREGAGDAELLAALDEILARAPGDPFFHLVRALVRYRAGDTRAAEEEAATWASAPLAPLDMAELVKHVTNLGFLDQARDWLDRALAGSPTSPELLRARLALLTAASEWDRAEAAANDLLATLPAGHAYQVDARWKLGVALHQRGEHTAALEQVRRIQELVRRGTPCGIPAAELEDIARELEQLIGR